MRVSDDTAARRQAAEDLVSATREVMYAAATTELAVGEMRDAEQALSELVRILGKESRPRLLRAPFDGAASARAAGPSEPWTMFAFNPLGIPLEIRFDGDTAAARLRTYALHEGPHESMHGGFSAGLMDVMLGVLMQARGTRALTASLDLRYLARIPLDVEVHLGSRVVETSGRKTVAEGWIEHRGRRMVEARGLFIDVQRDPA